MYGCSTICFCPYKLKDLGLFTVFQWSWKKKQNCYNALFLCGHTFSLLRNKYIGVGVWECMVSICLALRETGKRFSKVAAPLCLPISNVWGSSSCSVSSSLPALGFLSFTKFSYSNRCVMVSHCGFNFHFPNDKGFWTLFVLILHPYVFFDKLFKCCAHLKHWLFVFLLLSSGNSFFFFFN